MNLLVGDRNQWYPVGSMLLEQNPIARARKRGSLKLTTPTGAGGPIFVRPAVRELLTDDNPFADFMERISDEIDRRVQSRRERLQSSFRWWLDYRPGRALYRAQKAGKLRLPRLRHIGRRMLAKFNGQIDRWVFSPEGNPNLDRAIYVFFSLVVIFLIAQLVRAWAQ